MDRWLTTDTPPLPPSVSSIRMPVPMRTRVTFRQIYRSDVFKGTGTKTLVMVKSKGKWLIHEERVK